MPTKITHRLTTKQLKLLETLYDYRFGTTDLLARSVGLKDGRYIHARLDSLFKQGYIGKNYDKSYRRQSLPATYYLLPKSFPSLKQQDGINPKILKNIYKDRTASPRFINQNLTVFRVFHTLSELYSNRIGFSTQSELRQDKFSFFPQPIPDGFINFRSSTSPRARPRYFFALVLNEDVPLFVHTRMIKKYVEYVTEQEWERSTKAQLRGVLIICQSINLLKRLRQKIGPLLDDEEVARFAYTTEAALNRASLEDDAVWQLMSRPLEVIGLGDM
jgi:hypothetical protein